MERFNVRYKGGGFRGYPIGRVAYYGPNDKKATKAVAAMIRNYVEEVSVMRKWMSSDAIHDGKVREEISVFLGEDGVKSVTVTESPIGCIHEEDIDFLGGKLSPSPILERETTSE